MLLLSTSPGKNTLSETFIQEVDPGYHVPRIVIELLPHTRHQGGRLQWISSRHGAQGEARRRGFKRLKQ